jgi:type I restriction enzyme M protein
MSSNTSGEGDIRKAIIEADLVDCMVALPGQLFYSTQIPVCLWFLTRSKGRSATRPGERDRRGETLFIDARKLGTLTDRVHRDLTEEDIEKIAGTYHAWKLKHEGEVSFYRAYDEQGGGPSQDQGGGPLHDQDGGPSPNRGDPTGPESSLSSKVAEADHVNMPTMVGRPYVDIAGFCKSATIEEIRAQGYVLTPGRYVGAAEAEEDGEPFEEKMRRLAEELEAQFEDSAVLEQRIRENLARVGQG